MNCRILLESSLPSYQLLMIIRMSGSMKQRQRKSRRLKRFFLARVDGIKIDRNFILFFSSSSLFSSCSIVFFVVVVVVVVYSLFFFAVYLLFCFCCCFHLELF